MKKAVSSVLIILILLNLVLLSGCGENGYSGTIELSDGYQWVKVSTKIVEPSEGGSNLSITLEGPQAVNITCDERNYDAILIFTDEEGFSMEYQFLYHAKGSGQSGMELYIIGGEEETTTEKVTEAAFSSPAPTSKNNGPEGVYVLSFSHIDNYDFSGEITTGTDVEIEENAKAYLYFDGTGDKYSITVDDDKFTVTADITNKNESDYKAKTMPQYSDKELEFTMGSGYWNSSSKCFSYFTYDKETKSITVIIMTVTDDDRGIPFVSQIEESTYILTDYKNIEELKKAQ